MLNNRLGLFNEMKGHKGMKKRLLFLVVLGLLSEVMPVSAEEVEVVTEACNSIYDDESFFDNRQSSLVPYLIGGIGGVVVCLFVQWVGGAGKKFKSHGWQPPFAQGPDEALHGELGNVVGGAATAENATRVEYAATRGSTQGGSDVSETELEDFATLGVTVAGAAAVTVPDDGAGACSRGSGDENSGGDQLEALTW